MQPTAGHFLANSGVWKALTSGVKSVIKLHLTSHGEHHFPNNNKNNKKRKYKIFLTHFQFDQFDNKIKNKTGFLQNKFSLMIIAFPSSSNTEVVVFNCLWRCYGYHCCSTALWFWRNLCRVFFLCLCGFPPGALVFPHNQMLSQFCHLVTDPHQKH